MSANSVTIKDFPTPEARMMVLTEGFTCPKLEVREACINFFRPTVTEFVTKNDIAAIM